MNIKPPFIQVYQNLPRELTPEIFSFLSIDFFSPDFLTIRRVNKEWSQYSLKILTAHKRDCLTSAFKVLNVNTQIDINPNNQKDLYDQLVKAMILARDTLSLSKEGWLYPISDVYAEEIYTATFYGLPSCLSIPSPIVTIASERRMFRLREGNTSLHSITITLAKKGCFQLAQEVVKDLEPIFKPTAYYQIVCEAIEKKRIAIAIHNLKMFDHTKFDLELPKKIAHAALEAEETELLFTFLQARKRIKGQDLFPKIGKEVIDTFEKQGKADQILKFKKEFSPKTI